MFICLGALYKTLSYSLLTNQKFIQGKKKKKKKNLKLKLTRYSLILGEGWDPKVFFFFETETFISCPIRTAYLAEIKNFLLKM